MNKPKVNIILATYNGEKHIRKQLDSLLTQTYDNIDIYIRDDGSTDETVDVIKEYMNSNTSGKKIILLDNGNVNLRCPKSFYEILKKCEKADYYSLCDQDDIWYPNKVEWAVEKLEQENSNQILLYYSACDYSDEQGNLIRKSPIQKKNLQIEDVLYYTPGSGFTIVFNEKTREELLLDVVPGKELHDRWLIRGAACFGKVIYDERCTASHIRHESAVTAGDAGTMNLILNFLKAELCGNDGKQEKEALEYFASTFESRLSATEKKTLRLFYARDFSILRWLQKVFYPRRLRRRLSGELALRFLFLVGKA